MPKNPVTGMLTDGSGPHDQAWCIVFSRTQDPEWKVFNEPQAVHFCTPSSITMVDVLKQAELAVIASGLVKPAEWYKVLAFTTNDPRVSINIMPEGLTIP